MREYEHQFKPPQANGTFVHNDSVELRAISPTLNATDTSESARLLRNHVLGGGTMPEHWFGGGGDVNRAAAAEMGGPTFKTYTMRQSYLKLMLEEIGRYVLLQAARVRGEVPDWSQDRWQVTAVFPELVSGDLTKFAAAMQQVTQSVLLMADAGLLTQETALKLVADVAQRFGQDFDAKTELAAAKEEHAQRQRDRAAQDVFGLRDDARAAQL